jgi:hypothetical protein
MSGRIIFDRLKAEGWKLIEEWHANREEETQHLEFKRKETHGNPEPEAKDKAHVAKAASGFANVEDGVVVLGLDTDSKKGGADRVSNIVHITDVRRFGGRIERLLPTLTDPAIANLDVHAVEDPSRPGAGVLAIYVPESYGGPHRVANATTDVNDKYFMRTATQTVVMPHGLLGDRFIRAARPELELQFRFYDATNGGIELRLRNVGRGSAVRPAIHLTSLPHWFRGHAGSKLTTGFIIRDLADEEGRRSLFIEPHEDVVIYPGSDRVVAHVASHTVFREPLSAWEAQFRGILYALNAQPVEGETTLQVLTGEPMADLIARRAIIRRSGGAR